MAKKKIDSRDHAISTLTDEIVRLKNSVRISDQRGDVAQEHAEELRRECRAAQIALAASQAENAQLNASMDSIVRKHLDEEGKLKAENAKLRTENGRLKRIAKALKEAFLAASEEDAPPLPFG